MARVRSWWMSVKSTRQPQTFTPAADWKNFITFDFPEVRDMIKSVVTNSMEDSNVLGSHIQDVVFK
jgi:hypothetical protein